MSSVAWSPVHPAVFAAIDVTGRLDLWNLNNNTESPTASTILDNSPLLKSLMWSQNGTHLSVGDENGKISVFQVGEVSNNNNFEFVHVIKQYVVQLPVG